MKPLFYSIVLGLLTAATIWEPRATITHAPLYSPNQYNVGVVSRGRTNWIARFQAGNDPVKNYQRFNRAVALAQSVPPQIRRVDFKGTWNMALDYTSGTFQVSADTINHLPTGAIDPGPQTNALPQGPFRRIR